MILIGSFGRRASDGGANLQIYYTTSANSGQSVEPIYGNSANAKDLRIGVDSMQQQHNDNMSIAMDGNDEQSDEIQRYVHCSNTRYGPNNTSECECKICILIKFPYELINIFNLFYMLTCSQHTIGSCMVV